MDKETRNAIECATQRARKLLEDDFALQLEGTFDVLLAAGHDLPDPRPRRQHRHFRPRLEGRLHLLELTSARRRGCRTFAFAIFVRSIWRSRGRHTQVSLPQLG